MEATSGDAFFYISLKEWQTSQLTTSTHNIKYAEKESSNNDRTEKQTVIE